MTPCQGNDCPEKQSCNAYREYLRLVSNTDHSDSEKWITIRSPVGEEYKQCPDYPY